VAGREQELGQYRQDVQARAKNHILPLIGDTPMNDITRHDLINLTDRLKIKRLHSASVAKIHGYLTATFKHAIASGIIERNLAEDIRPLLPTGSPVKNRAALGKDQLPEFLAKLDKYQGRYETIIALKLLMWTATRPQETYAARWCEFDLDKGLWTPTIERMKKRRLHIIPLQTQAISALRELHRVTGHGAYLFPNQTKPDTHMSMNTLNFAIQKRMGFDATAHGVRATFSTMANELDLGRPDIIEVSLAHVDGSVRGIYNRADYLEERRATMQRWADYLDGIKAGVFYKAYLS
jgi:integrase